LPFALSSFPFLLSPSGLDPSRIPVLSLFRTRFSQGDFVGGERGTEPKKTENGTEIARKGGGDAHNR
jgi:hypothetical protein